jgi:branched-subunit amino acid transport protein
MSTLLVPLALLMAAATYPWRAIPLLAPGIQRLPPAAREFLRLVGPAMLATLAAVSVMVSVDAAPERTFHVGVEWLAVLLCVALVAARRGLLLGLLAGAGGVAVLRALNLA